MTRVDVAVEEAPHSAALPRLDKIDLVARALPAGLALAARLAVGPLPIDDAYITFRYARNLAEGLGFAYNPGERVLGTTTPLWTLLLASLHGLTDLDLPRLSLVLSALLDAGTTLLLLCLAGRLGLGHGWAVLVATLFALNPLSIAYATGGMESSLFTFLVVGEEAYAAAGPYLAPRLGPDTVVAMPEFGAFGYVTGARILDTVGLVSPRATRYYPLPSDFAEHNAVPPELIREERPDFLVGLERFLPEQLVGAEWFRRGYRSVASFEAPIWGSRMVVIYERVGTGREPPDE